MEVSSLEDYPKAFALAVKARSTALAVLSTPLTNSSQDRIAELAAKHRLPSIHNRKEFVAQGGLMSLWARPNGTLHTRSRLDR